MKKFWQVETIDFFQLLDSYRETEEVRMGRNKLHKYPVFTHNLHTSANRC